MSAVERAATAVDGGGLVVIPTDTVYGLACSPYRKEPVRRLSELKGRSPDQPIALLAASVDVLLECVPELRGRNGTVVRALLPGPFTLVLENPACRFPWLTGNRPDTIGVRVPALTGAGSALLERVRALAATSANLHGGLDPRRLADVPDAIRAEAVLLDGGELPGMPSTVLDLTGARPAVVREGAVTSADALTRLHQVLAE